MIVACHCEGRGWKFWADSNLKGKFWGRSIQLDPVGVLTLQFEDGETFQWSKVTTSIYNIILGKIYCDHYGTMRIKGSGNYSCKLKFKEQSIIDRNPHQVIFVNYIFFCPYKNGWNSRKLSRVVTKKNAYGLRVCIASHCFFHMLLPGVILSFSSEK